MTHLPANEWKHTTAANCHQQPVAIEFFDDEQPGFVSIYERYADGTRWPCRSVNLSADHAESVLGAWAVRGAELGTVNDHRANKVPVI